MNHRPVPDHKHRGFEGRKSRRPYYGPPLWLWIATLIITLFAILGYCAINK